MLPDDASSAHQRYGGVNMSSEPEMSAEPSRGGEYYPQPDPPGNGPSHFPQNKIYQDASEHTPYPQSSNYDANVTNDPPLLEGIYILYIIIYILQVYISRFGN